MNNDFFQRCRFSIHLFYLILFFLLFGVLKKCLLGQGYPYPYSPVEILSWIPEESFVGFKLILGLLGFGSLLTCCIYPWSRVVRTIVCIVTLFSIGLNSSYGKVIHGYYGWLFASLALVFLPSFKSKNKEFMTQQVFFCAQFSAVMCYAMAGLWKIRSIPDRYHDQGWNGIFRSLGNSIAYEHLFHSYSVSQLSQFFLDHDVVTGLMFLCLVALQSFSPVLVLFSRTHLFLGLMILLFHVMSELILKIRFRFQTDLMVFLFVFSPFNSYYQELFSWLRRKAKELTSQTEA